MFTSLARKYLVRIKAQSATQGIGRQLRIAAAVHSVLEPLEDRTMMSFSAPTTYDAGSSPVTIIRWI